MWIFQLKHGLEMDFYWSEFTDLGADRKLTLAALQRHHFFRNPNNIDAFRDHVLIFEDG